MKKKLLVTIIVFFILSCAFIIYNAFFDTKYSLENVKKIVALSFDEKNNVFLKKEYIDENRELVYTEYHYKKDGKIYIKSLMKDVIVGEVFVFEDLNINVNYFNKMIVKSKQIDSEKIKPEENNSFYIAVKNNELYSHLGVYDFIKTEFIDGHYCIKVSIKNNYEENNCEIIYYWIDVKTGNILKMENYKNDKYAYAYIYTYEDGIVSDDDIKEYEENKYTDFVIIDFD